MAREQGQFGQGNPKQGGGQSQRPPNKPMERDEKKQRPYEEREQPKRDRTQEEEEEES